MEHSDYHAARMFVAAAEKGYRSLESFASWFTAGTAAALGLAAANVDKLPEIVELGDIKAVLPWLGTILILVLTSRFFGTLIVTMAASMQVTSDLIAESKSMGMLTVSAEDVAEAIRRATPWPVRSIFNVARWTRQGKSVNLGSVAAWLLMVSGGSAMLAAALTIWLWFRLLG